MNIILIVGGGFFLFTGLLPWTELSPLKQTYDAFLISIGVIAIAFGIKGVNLIP